MDNIKTWAGLPVEESIRMTEDRLHALHVVDTCPITACEGGLNLLHEADDDAVIWLESTATAAVAK